MIMRYFKNKAENYKIKDRRAGRAINEEEHITAEWCLSQFKSSAKSAILHLTLKLRKVNYVVLFTCQRLDNSIAHHIDNSTSFCVYCNVSAH